MNDDELSLMALKVKTDLMSLMQPEARCTCEPLNHERLTVSF